MEAWHAGAIIGGFVGGLIGGLMVLRRAMSLPERHCPNCGERFPGFRRAVTFRQMLWGGYTCGRCGYEVDRHGAQIQRTER